MTEAKGARMYSPHTYVSELKKTLDEMLNRDELLFLEELERAIPLGAHLSFNSLSYFQSVVGATIQGEYGPPLQSAFSRVDWAIRLATWVSAAHASERR